MRNSAVLIVLLLFFFPSFVIAQYGGAIRWLPDGESITRIDKGQLVKVRIGDNSTEVLVPASQFNANGKNLLPGSYTLSADQNLLLLFTNTARVWRYNTRGDYWLLNRKTGVWKQVGSKRPSQSLMFAKFSPDFNRIAYVSEQNIYVEDISTGEEKALTTMGNRKLINGTFDWVYEEEFYCRDGFRWSPDGNSIAYWQVNAAGTRDFFIVNNTDSIYSQVVPIEYPKAGEPPSAVRIGVVSLANANTTWMKVPGDTRSNYIPRIDWNGNEVIVQQLTRKQNETTLWRCNATTGDAVVLLKESDPAWIEVLQNWSNRYTDKSMDWLDAGKSFLWASEKDGWRHLYIVNAANGEQRLITKGNFDVINVSQVDQKNGYIYYYASPENATQTYLFRSDLKGNGTAERMTPKDQPGSHSYNISPDGRFAFHNFSNHMVSPVAEWIRLPEHKTVTGPQKVQEAISKTAGKKSPIEYIKIKTEEGVEMDAMLVKPGNFDPGKKYPLVVFVYTEPASAVVQDEFGSGLNFLYDGDMAADGYFQICIDNRGTPVPKGREWRKSIYRKIGLINIRDQAMAVKEILKWKYIDAERVAVWGWSGGGTATLNLMFQFPEIFKTGISIAAVVNQLTYDNVYQERFMGLPVENREDFIKGSPVTYAKNLKGNLLYIHGTGDDNVHYQNAELLLNELIKYNKQFRFMPYPNRTHGINEGEGTEAHLKTLYTQFLREHCPPGGR